MKQLSAKTFLLLGLLALTNFGCASRSLASEKEGGASDGGGVEGSLVNEITGQVIRGPLGSIRNSGITLLDLENDPAVVAAKKRLRELDKYLPDFSKNLLQGLAAKMWILDPKALSSVCLADADTYFKQNRNKRVVACQNSKEVRVSMAWFRGKQSSIEYRRDLILHELFMNKFLETNGSYDDVIALDALVATPVLLSEQRLHDAAYEALGLDFDMQSEVDAKNVELQKLIDKREPAKAKICAVIPGLLVTLSAQKAEAVAYAAEEKRLRDLYFDAKPSERRNLDKKAREARNKSLAASASMSETAKKFPPVQVLTDYSYACYAEAQLKHVKSLSCVPVVTTLRGEWENSYDITRGLDNFNFTYQYDSTHFIEGVRMICAE